jgi:hypothetical protein
MSTMRKQRILLLYFSYSSQAKNLLQALAEGFDPQEIEVGWERIEPEQPLKFPLGSIPATLAMMLTTFLRRRLRIRTLSPQVRESWDLIILAGPTWSYNPSGPVLDLLDRFGAEVFDARRVIALITCRGYWRTHWWYLKRRLVQAGATVVNRMVFSHLNPEPWRTIGVFLKLAGRVPERAWLISHYYTKYGHTRKQLDQARVLGGRIAKALTDGTPLESLDLQPGREKPPECR